MNDRTFATITLQIWANPADVETARTNCQRHSLVIRTHLQNLIHTMKVFIKDSTKRGYPELARRYEDLLIAAEVVLKDVEFQDARAAEFAEQKLGDEEAAVLLADAFEGAVH